MKKISFALVASVLLATEGATVSNVTAKQRYPWNGLVDITCQVTEIDSSANPIEFALEVVNQDSGDVKNMSHFWVVRNGVKSTDRAVETNGSYRLLWDAGTDLDARLYTNMVVRVNCVASHEKIQLWEGGPYWATTNIGAENPEDYGWCFWWGDTVGYKSENNTWVASDGSSSDFSFTEENVPTYNANQSTLQSEGWITVDGVLAPERDAAHVQWGGAWRMPTLDELNRLLQMCDWEPTTKNGVNGYVVRGRGCYASDSIFLPLSGEGDGLSRLGAGSYGFFWSSVLISNDCYARSLYFTSWNAHYVGHNPRYAGLPVRPVQELGALVGEAGDSAPLTLDLCATPLVDSMAINWNSAWIGGDASAMVVIADNGMEVKRTTGAGEFEYTPTSIGRHELTYTTYIDGVAQEEVYTAIFFKDWKYEIDDDGGAIIIDTVYKTGYINPPTEINGFPITRIASGVRKCLVTFDANGGTGGKVEALDWGSAITVPTVSRVGYTFKGWTPEVAETVPANDVTYTAKWVVVPTLSEVTAIQRYPWNGMVDIGYTVVGDFATEYPGKDIVLRITAVDRNTGEEYKAVASALSGDIGTEEGVHHVVWDMKAQGLEFKSEDVVFSVAYEERLAPYCVIDLSAGANATSYPVSYLDDVPSGGWSDEYKTTKLVLRRIDPGTFMMCGQYEVILTKPYYIGIFEVTQKQYELVMGTNPSSYKGDMRPVEWVSYNAIRGTSSGSRWPASSDVDASSFMGRLREKIGLEDFDLPTEAQWEYACRAGTTSTYNNGGDSEDDLKALGRYQDNKTDGKGGYSQHTTVGAYFPNAWGLYDMHGNVIEWCLDWYGAVTSGCDPVGPSSGLDRVLRGGSLYHVASNCTSSSRDCDHQSDEDYDIGFRLVRTLTDPSFVGTICTGESSSVDIDLFEEPEAPSGVTLGDPYCYVDWTKSGDDGALWCREHWDWTDCWADAEDWAVVPINGATDDDELIPVIVYGSADESMVSEVGIEDEATFKARFKSNIEYDIGHAHTDPDYIKSFVASRKWLIAKISYKAEKITPKTFFMGLKGGSEYRKFVIVWNHSDGAIEDGYDDTSETAVLPLPVGSATVSNNGSGARTVTVAPSGGYVVTGWSDDETNTATVRELQPSKSPYYVMLEAESVKIRTITFDVNGGECGEVSREVEEGEAVGELPVPTRVGYVFAGWYTESSGGTQITEATIVSSDVTYYAHWDELQAVYSYTANSDGTITLTGVIGDVPEDLVIPAQYNGKMVSAIGDYAFDENLTIRRVTLPNGLKRIGKEAFDNCLNLESINFPEGLEVIGHDALCGCESLGDVVIPSTVREGISFAFAYKMNSITVAEGNPYFKSIDGVVYSKDGTQLICYPAGRTGEWTVPSHVTEIADAAFAGCSISTVNINPEVVSIGQGAFICCFRLAHVNVDDLNQNFSDVDGVLFTKDCATLIMYPPAKNDVSVYTVPSTVTSLYEAAFSGSLLDGVILPSTLRSIPEELFVDCANLTSVIVGCGLETVGECAFHCAEKIKKITLPTSLKQIDCYAFEDSGSLTTIYIPTGVDEDGEAFAECPAKVVRYSSALLVRFDLNYNGAPYYPYDRNVVGGEAVGLLPTPASNGFTFDGWYTEMSGGTKITSATKIASDTVFHAHWSAKIVLAVADGCEGMGTVSGGGGEVAAGKKVTLKATAKKGYVFAGWYLGDAPLEGDVDYRTATYPYVSTGEPTAITARFVPAEEDATEENIGFAISGTAGVYAAGEAIEQQVTVSSFSIPTVTVTGLPAGLKFDAKTLKITGKPTKPGELATATFTIKNQSNKTGKKETVAYRVGDATSGLLDLKYNTVPGEDGYALIVPGVETDMHGLLGLDPGDLAGWTITGLPAGLKFDSRTGTFSGKATQSGKTYLVTFKKGAEIATITLGTKRDPKLTLTKYLLVRDDIAPEVEDGTYYSNFKLTGGGNYQVGKKVSVSATAPKSWMFVGWASPSDLNPLDNTVRLTMVSTDAKYTFSMPSPGDEADEVELTAVFTHVFGSAIVPDDEIEE